ncbi:pyruvate dehydrogenase [acetyl-transferring]-phosphatase 1, mitochondrial isoform X1 [Helicoverpa zea]|uniref:pyruvate dehydrogenase [acetyl-transferring]-phosphatase 1, mitochondrial isoform X1 n=1 Tax=Helicoverpa zea TaxID=7113 RepID=UPI001F59EF64|nr:pyruvate dehydrogenase [acetyl-transferring]-phosphatase 1, mitochondrial isoform X1 [Helicoverpa zea]
MNSLYINYLVNSCLKLDLNAKRKLLLNNVHKNHNFVNQKCLFKASACSSLRQTDVVQAFKDGLTILPSPQEVTVILRKNEFNKEFTEGSVKAYDSNQLASNHPIEDTRCEATCTMSSGILMGVFDGHGGPQCAQVVSKRLFNYIAASLLPTDVLKSFQQSGLPVDKLVTTFNDKMEMKEDLRDKYSNSFKQYLAELTKVPREVDVEASLQRAIMRLDSDLSKEVLDSYEANGVVNPRSLYVALSGAVACVAHIDGPNLHVANVGDCNAVLGTMTDENEWIAKKITKEHNAENFDELKRIWNEHPDSERKTVIRRDRLLGELAPLRSIGDYRYKWPADLLNKLAAPFIGPKAVPANYFTPPYLTAMPDVYYHRLTPRDQFLIIASDGLWDMMSPLQAVKLVGEHMKGKVFFNPLNLPKKNIQLGAIDELLSHRKESLKSKPKDKNAATHLIRHAIGGTEYGVDHSRLAHLLSLPADVSRTFRDDMTVTIAYFDPEYLRQCPS